VINVMAQRELDALLAELAAPGVRTLRLDGSAVHDAQSLFAAAGDQLFGGEPIANWDSFADVLLNNAAAQEGETALVWTGAEQMLHGDLAGLLTFADMESDIARRVRAIGPSLSTYLLGSSEEFG
jgi:hypothetical protein